MTEHLRLIGRQLAHLQRMREYLAYSTRRVQRILPITNWQALSFEHHETLAAFRVRFSEFQEHLGKTMRAVAIEEEVEVERFGSVLAFMEKLAVLDSTESWKLIRERLITSMKQMLTASRKWSKLHRNYLSVTNDCLVFVRRPTGSNLNERTLAPAQ